MKRKETAVLKWGMLVGLLLATTGAIAGEPAKRPANTNYEVYYFHVSWRCVNCNNAEAWTREVADAFAKANEVGAVSFAPVEMEKNAEQVKAFKAKRVDVVVAEVVNGKRTRWVSLGNLLPLIKGEDEAKAKEAVKKWVRDGLTQFDAKAKTPWLATPPAEDKNPSA